MVLHATTPETLVFLQLHSAARFATAEYCSHEKTILLKHLQVLGPFTLPFPHSFLPEFDRACIDFANLVQPYCFRRLMHLSVPSPFSTWE